MMNSMRALPFSFTFILALALAAVLQISTVSAQSSQDDLHITIRTKLLADSRAAGLAPQQLDFMVDTLAIEAARKGMTAHDIGWAPEPAVSFAAIAESV